MIANIIEHKVLSLQKCDVLKYHEIVFLTAHLTSSHVSHKNLRIILDWTLQWTASLQWTKGLQWSSFRPLCDILLGIENVF